MPDRRARRIKLTMQSLRKLEENKNLSDSEVYDKASQIVADRINNERLTKEVESMFIKDKEKRLAKNLLGKYISDYTIETISDKNTLRQVIYLEILNTRLQSALNDISRKTEAVPKQMLDSVHSNLKEISAMKDKLGISRGKREKDTEDGFSYIQQVIKKYKNWLRENQGSRHMLCPNCGKMILMRIKTDAWEAQKHPFFKDRVLGNSHMISLYKEGKITRKDAAKILDVSDDYMDWLVDKWGVNNSESAENEQEKTEEDTPEEKTSE